MIAAAAPVHPEGLTELDSNGEGWCSPSLQLSPLWAGCRRDTCISQPRTRGCTWARVRPLAGPSPCFLWCRSLSGTLIKKVRFLWCRSLSGTLMKKVHVRCQTALFGHEVIPGFAPRVPVRFHSYLPACMYCLAGTAQVPTGPVRSRGDPWRRAPGPRAFPQLFACLHALHGTAQVPNGATC